MALIEHCRPFKPSSLYRISDIKGYKQVYIYQGDCPECLKTVYAWIAYDVWGNRYPQEGNFLVSKKTRKEWVDYINNGEAVLIKMVDKPGKGPKDMRARPIVGEGTLMMSRPVERVYKKILWAVSIRSEASAKELKNI